MQFNVAKLYNYVNKIEGEVAGYHQNVTINREAIENE